MGSIVQPSVIQPSVADTEFVGVSAPPQGVYLPNPVQHVFRLPTAPVSGETPLHRLVASDRRDPAVGTGIC